MPSRWLVPPLAILGLSVGLPAGAAAQESLGSAVGVSGEDVLVGRPGRSGVFPAPATRPGAVHVFRRADGGWREAAALSPEDLALGDGFGDALDVAGDWMVVGAPAKDGARGAAYVYRRADGRWAPAGRLAPSGGAAGDSLGFAVAIDGGAVVLGAPGAGEGGAAVVFEREGEGWREAARLTPPAPDGGGRFGAAVDVRGGLAVVGAPGPHLIPALGSAPPQPHRGGAHLFRRGADGAWAHEAALESGEEVPGSFGYAVLLDGGAAWISAPTGRQTAGVVYRFEPPAGGDAGAAGAEDPADAGGAEGAGGWTRTAVLTAAEPAPGTLLGGALARAGEDLLVGAPFSGQMAGAVHAFRLADGEWRPARALTSQAAGMAVFFGASLGADGDLAAVGAPGADFFEGLAYAVVRGPAGTWERRDALAEEGLGLEAVTGGELPCEDGEAADFSCGQVDLLAFLPVEAVGGRRGIMLNDVWGWTDPETGREYAIVGRFDGTSFVDVTDPTDPVYLGNLPLHEGAVPNLWRDMKVYRNHAFIVADGAGPHGMQVFDLTRLRDVADPPATFDEDAHYDRFHSAHNIVMDTATGHAFVVGASMGGETCGGGLHMVDVRRPEAPAFAGCHADPSTGNAGTGYTHDAQCVVYRGPDQEHRGREVCFQAAETALGIADVTDKDSAAVLASAPYPNVGYAHQGWLTEDHRYFYLNDELDELQGQVARTRTMIWDVTDLDDPILVKEHLGTNGATDHNLYVRGDRMYQSNYVGGLRVLDISDPESPEEIGFFDTVPWGEDVPGFAGSWSSYPFFESGTVIVTSMKEGLFLLRVRDRRPVSE